MKKIFILCSSMFLFISGLKSQTVDIPFSDYKLVCSIRTDSNKLIIRNKQDLFQLTNCNEIINFRKYILVGVHGAVGGCGLPKVEFKVTKDISQKKYLIESSVFQFGNCRRNNFYKRFILMERPPDDYPIEFELKKVTVTEENAGK